MRVKIFYFTALMFVSLHTYGSDRLLSFFQIYRDFPQSIAIAYEDSILDDSAVQELCMTKNTYVHDQWNYDPYTYFALGRIRISKGWILLFYRTTGYYAEVYACTYNDALQTVSGKIIIQSDYPQYTYTYKVNKAKNTIVVYQLMRNDRCVMYKYKLDINLPTIRIKHSNRKNSKFLNKS